MYTHVDVNERVFQCGKALIHSKLWKLESWDSSVDSLGARQFASLSGGGAGDAGSVGRVL